MSMFFKGFLAAVVVLVAAFVAVEVVGVDTLKSNVCDAIGC